MKCKRSIALMALVFTLALVPAVITYATKPTTAEGSKKWLPTITGIREADGNTFLYGTADTTWSGTFEGSSVETFTVVYHRSGFQWYKSITSFEGTVDDGKSGTLVFSKHGKNRGSGWSGTWVILSGTDELADLHGQGTWGGPGWDPEDPSVPGITIYEGKIHFDPS